MNQAPDSYIFSAFQVTPAGIQYEEEFLSLAASIESHSSHWMAQPVVQVVKKNNLPIYPVIGFTEFPGLGVGAAAEMRPGVYRAVVIGKREFLKECGLDIPETLLVAARRWQDEEDCALAFCGWDGWIRGVLKFQPESAARGKVGNRT